MNKKEIDTLISQRFFGWEVKGYNGYDHPFVNKDGMDRSPFSPSTDINHAWRVVEKLKNCGLEVAIYTDTEKSTCHIIDASSSLLAVWGADAETACLAICHATIKMISS